MTLILAVIERGADNLHVSNDPEKGKKKNALLCRSAAAAKATVARSRSRNQKNKKEEEEKYHQQGGVRSFDC